MSTIELYIRPDGPVRSARRPLTMHVLLSVALFALCSALAVAADDRRLLPLVVAGPVMLAVLMVGLARPAVVVVFAAIWLPLMGMVRRLAFTGAATSNDPMLLVGPAAVGVLTVVALQHQMLDRQTALSKWVSAYCALVVLTAVNPLNGSVAAGVAGLLFFLVPVMWFWVARSGLISDRLAQVLLVLVVGMGLATAAYGLRQGSSGFLPFEERWLAVRGLSSRFVTADVARPFSTFTNSQEYVSYLAIAFVVVVAWKQRFVGWLKLAMLATLGWAMALTSIRGALVTGLVAVMFVIGAKRRLPPLALVVAGALVLVAAVVAANQIDPKNLGEDPNGVLVARTVNGLSDPFNAKVSTLPAHWSLIKSNVLSVRDHPLGRGLAAGSIAGRLDASSGASGESDPERLLVALGLAGLVVLGGLMVAGARLCSRASAQRDWLAPVAIGVLMVTVMQWVNGAMYAVAPIPWLMLGLLDRHDVERRSCLPERPTAHAGAEGLA